MSCNFKNTVYLFFHQYNEIHCVKKPQRNTVGYLSLYFPNPYWILYPFPYLSFQRQTWKTVWIGLYCRTTGISAQVPSLPETALLDVFNNRHCWLLFSMKNCPTGSMTTHSSSFSPTSLFLLILDFTSPGLLLHSHTFFPGSLIHIHEFTYNLYTNYVCLPRPLLGGTSYSANWM